MCMECVWNLLYGIGMECVGLHEMCMEFVQNVCMKCIWIHIELYGIR